MTNVEARGIKCLIAKIADGVIFGLGVHSYVPGLEAMLYLLSNAPKNTLTTHGGQSGDMVGRE